MRGRVPYRQPSGLYVHSSPPTGVPVHDSLVRQWLRGGEISRLRQLVQEGGGTALVGEYSPDVSARGFLRALPRILSRIEEAHEAAASGDIDRLEKTIKKERSVRLELCKDPAGLSLLHKAVIHGHRDLQVWLLDKYPDLVHLVDNEQRSALHYAGSSPDGEAAWRLLTASGADPNLTDSAGNTPAYYMLHPRRVRPPQPRGVTAPKGDKGLVIKPANIRIWIHDRDLGRLQKVVWEGYGQKLLKETSTQPKVRRFLNAVPYILGSIRDVHKAAIENDVETLKKKTEDPVPKDILLSKDVNGLNPLHKAAGLGRKEAVGEIIRIAPEAANAADSFGRTPLHYAAALRDPDMYHVLVEGGATDHLLDKKGHTPSHYRSRPGDLDAGKLLTVLPEAPRTAHIFPPSWDWRLLHSATGSQLKESTETITQDSTAEEVTEPTQEISRDDEPMEESRPEISEDEGVGSENAQSVEDAGSPQNGENIDVEDDAVDKLGQTITISEPVFPRKMLVGPDEVSPGGGEESEKQSEVPDGERQKEDVSEQSSAIRNEVESTDDRPKTSVIHKENTEEKPEGSKENTTGSEHVDTTAVEKPPAPEPRQKDPAHKATDSEMRDKSSTSTKSGRQSLKSRVKKVMWLGRMHGSGRTSARREDVEDAVISQIAGPPSNTNDVNNTVEQPAVEKETSKPSENEMSNEKMSETSVKSNDKRISSEDDHSVGISKAVEPDQARTPEDSDPKQSQLSQDNNEIKEVTGAVDKEDSPSTKDKAEEETNPENNSNQDTKETGFEVDSLNIAEDESEEKTEGHNNEQEEIEDGNNNLSSEETLKSGISGARRAEAERLVATGDMEAMAEMVLAGEGDALLDLTSDNPDVQLFINNVPQYMAKIEKVHKCSREGDLRGVRTSLDRRKYAVARDNSTSLKPTPLHVAVLFGRTSVLRYLAGRFPETMHAQDSGGRTPLHYAATLPDNGHFYSLLITLGADKAIVDNAGKTAEEYLKDKEGLSRETLLAEYQDRPVPIDTSGLNFNRYSDKVENDTVSARHDVDEEALLEQMERCFKLLSTRAPGSALGRILNRDLFEELQLYYTKLDNTLLDIIRPMGKDLAVGKNRILSDPNFSGITIPDQESFILFRKLIEPLIKELSGVTEFNNEPSDYFGNEDQNFFNIDLDPGGVIVKSCVIEVVRNLSPLSFVKNLKLSELEKVEVALSTVLTSYYRKNKESAFVDEAGENHGSYYTLGEILENKEVYQDLKEEGLVINGVEEGEWPYGTGVFISPYGDITAWMNIREHIHLLSVTSPEKRGLIGAAYKTAFEIIQSLEEKVSPTRDSRLGLLASEPGFVGNCLRIHVLVSLPHIGEDLPSLRKLCSSRNLLVEENSRPGLFRLRNRSCQNMTEINLLKSLISSITDIIEMEKVSMRGTVAQIPNLIKNFLRKKSSKEKLK